MSRKLIVAIFALSLCTTALRAGGPVVVRPDGLRTPLNPRVAPLTLPPAIARATRARVEALQALHGKPPASVSLAAYQTPIRDQKDRGTCGVFASVAALEAAYKRVYHLDLDLSEQYFFHATKSSTLTQPRYYQYENQSSFWSGAGSQVLAQSALYAVPPESTAPYRDIAGLKAVRDSIPEAGALAWAEKASENKVTQDQVDAFEYSTKYIIQGAREAARYGAKQVTLLGKDEASSPATLEAFIANNQEVAIDVTLDWKYNKLRDLWEYDATAKGGGHAMLVIGYQRSDEAFILKNSWGGKDYYRVSYDVIRNCAGSGAVIEELLDPKAPTAHARWLGVWNMDHDGWRGRLVIRRLNGTKASPTRLGHYRGADGRSYAVNGYFEDAGRTMVFYLTDGDDTPPTELKGQWFRVFNFSRDAVAAAGTTAWGAGTYGVFLSRSAIPATPAVGAFKRDKWLGTWKLTHDGWTGQLLIDGIGFGSNPNALVARYRDEAGAWKRVNGEIRADAPATARFEIAFDGATGQPFTLHYHGREEGRASGETTWNGARFGTTAKRQ